MLFRKKRPPRHNLLSPLRLVRSTSARVRAVLERQQSWQAFPKKKPSAPKCALTVEVCLWRACLCVRCLRASTFLAGFSEENACRALIFSNYWGFFVTRVRVCALFESVNTFDRLFRRKRLPRPNTLSLLRLFCGARACVCAFSERQNACHVSPNKAPAAPKSSVFSPADSAATGVGASAARREPR